MLSFLIALLVLLWLLRYVGFGPIVIPEILWNILVLLVIAWVVGILPRPFREIASILLVFWLLTMFGVIAIAGLPQMLLLVIVVGLVMYVISESAWRRGGI